MKYTFIEVIWKIITQISAWVPSTPSTGQFWYNSTINKFQGQKSGSQVYMDWTRRVVSAASYTTSTTINADITDIYTVTLQAWDLLFNNPSGTPVDGQMIMLEVRDSWASRILTYGAQFANWAANLIGATTISKWSWMVVKWNATDSKWYCMASGTQP